MYVKLCYIDGRWLWIRNVFAFICTRVYEHEINAKLPIDTSILCCFWLINENSRSISEVIIKIIFGLKIRK